MAWRPTSLLPLGVLLLLGLSAAACAQDKRHSSEADINRLTDDILAGIATYANDKNLTSIDLPDVEQRFSTTVAWILSITGSLNLTEGSVTQFQNVRRHQSSMLTFLGSELVLRTGVEIPQVEASYDFRAYAGVVTQSGKLGVSVSGLKATTMVVMDMSTLNVFVAELKIADMGAIKVKVQDGVVGWLASAISNLVVGIMKKNLRTAVEQQLPPVLNAILAKLDIADMIRPHFGPTL